MTVETWDRASLLEQEQIIGRTKGEGGPLSGGAEFTAPDFAATGTDGAPLMPVDSHVRLAHPSQNAGVHMLRRGYSFVDGTDGLGRLDAGLFFMAYQRDPRTAFVPVQKRSRPGTRSTSTSCTSGRACTPYRPARSPAPTGHKACSPDQARRRVISDVSWRR